MLYLFTDGARQGGTPSCGSGGWAYVAVLDGQEIDRDYDHEARTTHQKMELRACIEALSSLAPGTTAVVVSDSAYVVNCFDERWYERWERNGWRSSSKKPVLNPELWRELITLVRDRHVTFEKVPGHAGHKWNELAHELATAMAAGGRGSAA
jgi:ribonuclease HI